MPEQPSNIWDKLLRGVQSAVELRVVTIIDEVSVNNDSGQPEIKFTKNVPTANVIATSINLAEGDITNVVPEQFWAPDKEPIRAYHEQQVQKGHEIVRRNLQLIGEVGRSLINIVSQVKSLEESKNKSKDEDKNKSTTGT